MMGAARSSGPVVHGLFERRTFSVQYLVADPATRRCAIVDPVLDFDPQSGATATASADAILDVVRREGLSPQWVIDTHPHADHFSAAVYLKEKLDVPMMTGARVVDVQRLWKDIYGFGDEFRADGSQWDRLLGDGEEFAIGQLKARAMLTPGHTLASIAIVVGDAAFIHDTLFMPDGGTARADFPGGDARALYRSIVRILALPEDTRLFSGHDYLPGGREPRFESTIADQRSCNTHLVKAPDEEAFVALRTARDATLPMPKLILHALQVNLRGGRLPEPEGNGRRYLKIPLNALAGAAWAE